MTHPVLDAQQDAGQHGAARGLQHPGGDQLQQRRLADRDRQARLPHQPVLPCGKPGTQPEPEVLHQPQALQLAVEGLQFQPAVAVDGLQFHHRLDLQLEHPHLADHVAVAARADGFELGRVEQGLHDTSVVVKIARQSFRFTGYGKVELLAGTEGQGHGLGAGRA